MKAPCRFKAFNGIEVTNTSSQIFIKVYENRDSHKIEVHPKSMDPLITILTLNREFDEAEGITIPLLEKTEVNSICEIQIDDFTSPTTSIKICRSSRDGILEFRFKFMEGNERLAYVVIRGNNIIEIAEHLHRKGF